MDEFEQIREKILTCTNCDLCKTRHNPVFGEGNRNAPVMVIGEGPGYYEDMEGRPFVGRSGQLLDKIFAACGFTRDKQIFIGNIVKCRPPENRTPTSAEMAICIPYLYRQIELIDPKIIILLGSTALKGLIDSNAKITQMRGQWIEWRGRWVMPTYHPSALLRNPGLKRDAWEDFKKVIDKYRETVDPKHYSKYH
jgi:DNA polymerase